MTDDAARLPPLKPAGLPEPLTADDLKLRGKLARITRSIRDLEARNARMVARHAELVAERQRLAREWTAVRERRGAP